MKCIIYCGLFVLGVMISLLVLGLVERIAYRSWVPIWRQVEIDCDYPATKIAFLGDQVRKADYVVLGDSVALRGIDTGCFSVLRNTAVNLGISSADAASFYATVSALRWARANTRKQNALVVVYPDMFKAWSEKRAENRAHLPTSLRGVLHLLRYGACTKHLALHRFRHYLLDATWYRIFPRPLQVKAIRAAILGKLDDPTAHPERFITHPIGVCACDTEILPYHKHRWWVENHHCSTGSEPSFPQRAPSATYEFMHRNNPVGIPSDYPYTGYVDVLKFLKRVFRSVTLVVFPDRYGLSDPAAFNDAMVSLAKEAEVSLVLLTDLDVSNLFYDEHHALPSGMRFVTAKLLEQLGGCAIPGS